MCVLKFGGKFGKGATKPRAVCTASASRSSTLPNVRGGSLPQRHVYQQNTSAASPPAIRRIARPKVGTKTTFKPDHDLPQHVQLQHPPPPPAKRPPQPRHQDHLQDERTGEGDTFQYNRGILEFVEHLNRASEPLHPEIIYIAGEVDAQETGEKVGMEIAMQYSSEYTENVHTYVNNICTTEGGTHLSGFRAALTRTLNNYGKKENMFKDLVPNGDDFREGSRRHRRVQHPQFEGQTKTKLAIARSRHRQLGRGRPSPAIWKRTQGGPGDRAKGSWRPRPARAARKARWSAIARPCRWAACPATPRLHQPRRRQVRIVPRRG